MFVEGIVIAADLDKFESFIEKHGLSRYRPNDVTGTMTSMFQSLIVKWRGVLIYGLDQKRGTEEVIIEIPFSNSFQEIVLDLERIKERINELGASITIVVLKDFVICRPARNRREAYYGTPARRRAIRILRKIKRKGGNQLYVEI